MVRFKLKLTLHTSWTDWTLMTIWWDLVFIAQFLLLKLLSSTDEHTYWLLSLQSKNLHSCQSSKTKNGLLWINKDERILILTCIINTTASNLKLTICSLYLLVFCQTWEWSEEGNNIWESNGRCLEKEPPKIRPVYSIWTRSSRWWSCRIELGFPWCTAHWKVILYVGVLTPPRVMEFLFLDNLLQQKCLFLSVQWILLSQNVELCKRLSTPPGREKNKQTKTAV